MNALKHVHFVIKFSERMKYFILSSFKFWRLFSCLLGILCPRMPFRLHFILLAEIIIAKPVSIWGRWKYNNLCADSYNEGIILELFSLLFLFSRCYFLNETCGEFDGGVSATCNICSFRFTHWEEGPVEDGDIRESRSQKWIYCLEDRAKSST
jgi:hypothetical protein